MKAPDLTKILENWPTKVLALAAALLLFLFHRYDDLEARTFSIPLRLVTDTTLVPAADYDHRVKVTVRGAAEVVRTVTEADLVAQADFSGHQGEGVYQAPIEVSRLGAAAETSALEVLVDPLVLGLHLETKLIRTVPVQPHFEGEPGRNFELKGFQVEPSVVTVEGPRSVVEALAAVQTEVVELRGKTDSFTLKTQLDPKSNLITFPYGSTVEVRGLMTSTLATLVLQAVPAAAVGLSPSLKLPGPLPQVRVKVRGTQQALAALEKDDAGQPTVAVTADLSAYTLAGEVPSVPLRVQLPDGVDLVELSPAVVSVSLEPKP